MVKYQNMVRGYSDATEQAKQLWNIQQTGEQRPESIDRPWIKRADQAAKYAAEYGKIHAQAGMSGGGTVRAAKCASIEVGTVFRLTHDAIGASFACRLTSKTLSAPGEPTVKIRFELERGISALPYHPTASRDDGPLVAALESITLYEFIQVPPKVWSIDVQIDFRLCLLVARKDPKTRGVNTWWRNSDDANYEQIGNTIGFGLKSTLHQNYPVPAVATTTQRYRTSNVAGVTTASAHGYVTGFHVTVSGFGGTGYNTADVMITVVDTTHFTFPSTGSDEGSSGSPVSDTGGIITPNQDDESESLQVDLDADTVLQDITKMTESQTEDMIDNNRILVFLINHTTPTQFEICTVRNFRQIGGVYKLKVRRAQFGTLEQAFTSPNDRAWIVYKDDLQPIEHTSFHQLMPAGESVILRLQSFTAFRQADLSNTSICQDISFTFSDAYAPVVSWVQLQINGAIKTSGSDFSGALATSTVFDFTMFVTDANGDIKSIQIVARRGSQEIVIVSKSIDILTYSVSATGHFLIPSEGDWQIYGIASDVSGRIVTQPLYLPGSSSTLLVLHINNGAGTPATPTAILTNPSLFGGTVSLECSTSGATTYYYVAAIHASPPATPPTGWSTASTPITVHLVADGSKTIYAYSTKLGVNSAIVSWDVLIQQIGRSGSQWVLVGT